jgi:WD40 repeat protein
MRMAAACPDRKSYEQVLSGTNLPEDRLEQLAAHLERCPACTEAVRGLLGADTVVAGVASATPLPAGEEQVVARLMEQLAQPTPAPVGALTDTAVSGDESAARATELSALLAPPQAPGELGRLAHYRVLGVLGRGGMGFVLHAEDTQLRRPVALKVLKPALNASPEARRRFTTEARAMAAVEHERIVPIYHIGEDRGVPFLAMPLLRGEALEARLQRAGKLPVAEAVRIAREIALGLAAAHARGLIHRDVKPANVWLDEHGAGFRVKLLDFGLARVVSGEATQTQSGMLLGTPAYMAPEQAAGQPVDARADLFGLGCVLYQMVTGVSPFLRKDTMSTLLAVARDQPPPPRQRNPAVPPALQALIVRLLVKDARERPASAQAVAARLAEIEAGSVPVSIVSPVRRRWRLAAMVAAGLLLLIGGGVLCQQLIVRFRDEKGNVVGEVKAPPGAKSAEVVLVPPEADPWPDGRPALSPMALVRLPAKRKGAVSWTLETALPRGRIGGHSLALSPDSRTVAAGGDDGVIRLWDLHSGQLVKALVGGHAVTEVAWSPDGKRLAAANSWGGPIMLWEPDAGRVRETIKLDSGASQLAWSPDGKYLAIALGAYGANQPVTTRLWQPDTEQLLPALPVSGGFVAWSPDSKTLAVAHGTEIQLLDLTSRTAVRKLTGHKSPVACLAWSPDGKQLASASFSAGGQRGGIVRFWDAATGAPGKVFGEDGPANAPTTWRYQGAGGTLAWSPDSKYLAAGGDLPSYNGWTSHHAAVLDPATGAKRLLWTGSQVPTYCTAWSRDGKYLAESTADGVIVYEGPDLKGRWAKGVHLSGNWPAVWAPNGRRLLSSGAYSSSYCWDLTTACPLGKVPTPFTHGCWSADGRFLATCAGGTVTVREADSLKSVVTFGSQASVVALSPNGKMAAVGSGKVVQIWNALNGQQVRALEGHTKAISAMAWSPDGKTLASGAVDGTVRLWDMASWKGRALEGFAYTDIYLYLTWSPDSQSLAAGAWPSAFAWSVADGRLLRKLDFGDNGIAFGGLAWSPDGKSFLCARVGGQVQRYELNALPGRDLFSLRLSSNYAGFSPDARLLGIPRGSALTLWQADSGRPVGTLAALRDDAWLAISPEGHYRGSPGIEAEIVYVVRTERGQEALTPAEFGKRYGWKNDPGRVRLLPQ